MSMEDMILVSVDDHVCEPPDMWDRHLTAQWKERAPRLVHKSDGTDVWVFEGQQIPNVGLNAVAGRPPEEYGMEPTALSQLRKGCYDIHARIEDMNVNGMLGSICFPSVPGFVGELFARQVKENGEVELATVMTRAYNDWHIDEWCGTYPGRFVPLAIPLMWDPKLMADEVRRVAKKGCHAITFPDTPGGLGYPSIHNDHWDPFWQACSDEGTVVCIHIGSGTGMNLQDVAAPIEIMIASTPISLYNCAVELVFSDALQKFPDLKIALSEGGTGWIPYCLERMDYTHEHHHKWTHHTFPDGKKPSDIFREHIITCFIDDEVGVINRDLIGIENITWECDYPHSDTTWPNAPERLWQSLKGLSDEEINKITYQNVMKHFRYDPFQHIPKQDCTVKALRAQAKHVDLTPKAGGGGKAPSDYEHGYATVGDIMKQMATAFSTAFDDQGAGVSGDPEAAATTTLPGAPARTTR
jgi:predicted TIM-barrel fold metal-dependent hydrolase